MVEGKPKIEVKLLASLREFSDRSTVYISANTVNELLDEIKSEYEDVGNEIFSDPDEGEINDFLNILVNGKRIETLDGTETVLEEEDTVAIFPSVGGGWNLILSQE